MRLFIVLSISLIVAFSCSVGDPLVTNQTNYTTQVKVTVVTNIVYELPGMETWDYTIKSSDVVSDSYNGYTYYYVYVFDDRIIPADYLIEVRQFSSDGLTVSQFLPYWSDLVYEWYYQAWFKEGYMTYTCGSNPVGYKIRFFRIKI